MPSSNQRSVQINMSLLAGAWSLQVIHVEWMRGNWCWVSQACRSVSCRPGSQGIGKLIEKTRLSHRMPPRIREEVEMLGKSLYLLGVFIKITLTGDFPGGPVVKTPRFYYRGHRFDPWSGN